ncbi:MAG: hypothetical protein AAGB05_00735 [Pseudomonadota bacterium]
MTLGAISAVGAWAQDGAAPAGSAAEAFRKNVTLLGVPPATVAPQGLVFAAVSFTDERVDARDDDDDAIALGLEDGSAAFGFGVAAGDIADLQFTANITSLEDDFADSGYFSVKASRPIAGAAVPSFVGVTFDTLAAWGDSDTLDPSVSVSYTAFPTLSAGGTLYPLMVTLGGGTDVRDFRREPGLFAGVGIGLTEAFGVSAAYNGDNVDLGASFRIPGFDQVGVTAVLNDAFDEDDQQRVILSLTWISENVF